ncbi:MAG: PQQ-binding-like beta-propeller repeat protein [Gemmataceae bacterium]|nr:PQQ-binding-like beta-propeller repeat protein [Gemmataceae bacterium]
MNRLLPFALCLALGCGGARAVPDADDKKPDDDKKPVAEGKRDPLDRNMADTVEKGVPDAFSAKRGKHKNIKWHQPLGSLANSGPVIAGGRIYIGTNNDKPRDPMVKGDKGVLMCFDQETGKFLWQIVHDKLEGGAAVDYPREGVASAPFVEGDTLWYVSNRAEIVCADAAKGTVKWKKDMIEEYEVYPCQLANSSPVVVGDLVYALTGNGVDINAGTQPSPKAPSLVAVDKKTGKKAWQFTCEQPVMRGQWSSPTAAKVGGKWQVLAACGDGWIYGLSADKGEMLWKFDLNRKKDKPFKPGGSGEKSFPIATPVVVGTYCYIACGQEPEDGTGMSRLWCIDISRKPANKQKDLSPAEDDFDPKSPKNKDSGLVWHYGGKLPKARDDGRDFDFGRTLSTVAVHDGVVYATELAGFLHALDAKTGEKLWEHDFVQSTWCSPYYVDGKVYVGLDSGEVHVFKAGRKKSEPKVNEATGMVKLPPMFRNGVMYLNCGTTLLAIEAPRK